MGEAERSLNTQAVAEGVRKAPESCRGTLGAKRKMGGRERASE